MTRRLRARLTPAVPLWCVCICSDLCLTHTKVQVLEPDRLQSLEMEIRRAHTQAFQLARRSMQDSCLTVLEQLARNQRVIANRYSVIIFQFFSNMLPVCDC